MTSVDSSTKEQVEPVARLNKNQTLTNVKSYLNDNQTFLNKTVSSTTLKQKIINTREKNEPTHLFNIEDLLEK